jgi:hypothetical protein
VQKYAGLAAAIPDLHRCGAGPGLTGIPRPLPASRCRITEKMKNLRQGIAGGFGG